MFFLGDVWYFASFMSNAIHVAIEELVKQIEEKEAEIVPLKVAVNSLCKTIGEEDRYSNTSMVSERSEAKLSFGKDKFHGVPLATSVATYLEMRKDAGLEKSATVEEILSALMSGGHDSLSGSEDNKLRSLKISLTKNTAQFSKIGDDRFGLKSWYKSTRRRKRSISSTPTHSSEQPEETEVSETEPDAAFEGETEDVNTLKPEE